MPTANQKKTLLSAKKAHGTLNRVIQMLDTNGGYKETIQQIDSVIGLLQSTRKQMVEEQLEDCLSNGDKLQQIQQLRDLYRLSK